LRMARFYRLCVTWATRIRRYPDEITPSEFEKKVVELKDLKWLKSLKK